MWTWYKIMLKKEMLNDGRTKVIYWFDDLKNIHFTTPNGLYKYNYYAFLRNAYEYSNESALYSQICTNDKRDLKKWIDDVESRDNIYVKTIDEFDDDDMKIFECVIFSCRDLGFLELELPTSPKTKDIEHLTKCAHYIFQMYMHAMIDAQHEDTDDFDFSFSYDSKTGIFEKKVRHGNVIKKNKKDMREPGPGATITEYVD